MSALTDALRNKSIFELLGITADGEQQEADLKEAELATLNQFLLTLKEDPANAEVAGQMETKLTALASATGEAYATQLDELYSFLNEKFSDNLTTRLEAAVEQFKMDVLTERIAFLKEKMQEHITSYFTKAEELYQAEKLEVLLPYLNEIQQYLKNGPK